MLVGLTGRRRAVITPVDGRQSITVEQWNGTDWQVVEYGELPRQDDPIKAINFAVLWNAKNPRSAESAPSPRTN